MSAHHRTWTPALFAALLAVALASGGTAYAGDDIETLTARQIAEKAREALLDAESVRITGEGDLREPGSPIELDLALDRSGNCAGTVGVGGEGSVEIIKRGETVWMKPDAAFWKNQVPGGGEAVRGLVGDRYLRGTTDTGLLRGIARVCDLDTFVDRLTDVPIGAIPLTKGEKTEVDGVGAIPVTGTPAGRTITLYVAAEGEPHPVRLVVASAGATKATVDFSDYDKPVPTATPPAGDSVDLNTLLG
ncbi:hypothetical protein SSP531S_09040 [Streptomyces spongiicola]|uniref:Lipoprotein n=1 Tax=Streptomyces spongiicola TaxID=1690221 RepID=A0A388SUT9_9ACTN|nr:hypothetical protein [Streptomyces spongiicola]GBP99509.1 hypothetical protein SSP531S_09040 [Streptomyces spongiicola]